MDRRLLILFCIVFVNFFGANIVLPTLPLYAQRHFDATPQQISFILAAFFIAQFAAGPVLGRLSDRYGRLPVLMISQIGTVISFIMMANAQSLTVLLLARILDGITGGNFIVVQAYITDISPRQKRTASLGITWMAFGLGYTLGPALGGLVAASFNDTAPFYIAAAVTLATVFLTYFGLPESNPPQKRVARMLQTLGQEKMRLSDITGNHVLLLIMLIGFMAQVSIALLQSTISLFGEAVVFAGEPTQTVNLGVGLMLACFGVGQFITQLVLIRPAVRRFGEHRLVLLANLARAAGFFSLTIFTAPLLVGGVSLMLIAIASGLMMPSLQGLATLSSRESISGGVLGVYQSAVTLGIITGTLIGGSLFAASPTLPYAVAGSILLLAAIPAVMLVKRRTQVYSPV